MKDNMQLVNFSELIWRKIRERQRMEGLSDEEFAIIANDAEWLDAHQLRTQQANTLGLLS